MSDTLEIKKAVQDAKKSLEEEKSNQLKEKVRAIVKQLLEAIDSKEKEIRNGQEELSILKKDLKDLEAGRLDLIEERQKNNELAKRVSVVKIERLQWDDKPWYSPYVITIPSFFDFYHPNSASSICNCGTTTYASALACSSSGPEVTLTATGNAFSMAAVGNYLLDSGKSVDIRPIYN